MQRFLFATLGSLGDLRPVLALALGARRAGHAVTVAADPRHREVVTEHGVDWFPLGDDGYYDDPAKRRQLLNPRHGTVAFYYYSNLVQLDRLCDELIAAGADASLLVANTTVMAAHLAAAALGRPMVAVCMSAATYHWPDIVAANATTREGAARVRPWAQALTDARRRLGLPPRDVPERELLTAPAMVLGLFPKVLPAVETLVPVRVVGYPILAEAPSPGPPGLAAWMAACRFVLFTFGSLLEVERLAAMAVEACRALGLSCLFQAPSPQRLSSLVGPDVRIEPFLPFARVMSQAAAVVLHAGIGTTAEALRTGCPMVAMPFVYDQPFNAEQLQTAGLAEVLMPDGCTAERMASAIRRAIDAGEDRRLKLAAMDIGVGEHIADEVVPLLEQAAS